MADPRLFTVTPCNQDEGRARSASQTSDRVNFFNALGKFGDLQVLNDIGGSKLGVGLRTLAGISNAIRTGTGALPTSIGSSVDAGARWVLEHAGITQAQVDAVSAFSPGIANQAYGQAKQVFQKVKQGKFKSTDIPNVFQDIQNLERLGRNIFTPSSRESQTITPICEASPYAVDLFSRAPKYKFLFIIQFVFNDGYAVWNSSTFARTFAFVVKRSTRPSLKFETEDVNYYNFRTKVVTKTTFDEMQMSFHDESSVSNSATRFVTNYMRAISPITNITSSAEMQLAEDQGMDFSRSVFTNAEDIEGAPAGISSASRGPLSNDNKQVFKEITLYHLYDYGQNMNVYHFFNPRITQLSQDDVDMSVGNEGNEVTLSFNYDSVYTELGISLSKRDIASIQTGTGARYYIYDTNTTKAGGGGTQFPSIQDNSSTFESNFSSSNIINTGTPPLNPLSDIGATFSNVTGAVTSTAANATSVISKQATQLQNQASNAFANITANVQTDVANSVGSSNISPQGFPDI